MSKPFPIPFSRPTIRKEEIKNALECLVNDFEKYGSINQLFEKSLADYLGFPFVSTFVSVQNVFWILLKLLNVQKQDEIILSSYNSPFFLSLLTSLEIQPILVDIDNETYLPKIDQIQQKITPKTKAIFLSYFFGIPSSTKPYQEFGIPVFADITQVIGSEMNNTKKWYDGEYAFSSFSLENILTTGGLGSALFLKNNQDYEKLVQIIETSPFYALKLSDLHAAVGIGQIKQLEEMLLSRAKIADFYHTKLQETSKILLNKNYTDRKRVYSHYLIQPQNMTILEAIQFFESYGIEARMPIEKPLHQILQLDKMLFPETEKVMKTHLAIPIYPTLKRENVELIVKIATKI